MALIILTFALISQLYAQDIVQVPNNGISVDIQRNLKCRRVNNTGSNNLMVPTKTRAEFDSFASATPPVGVSAPACAGIDSFEAMSGNVPAGGWTLFAGTPGCLSLDTVWKTLGTYSLQNTCAADTTNIRYNVDLTGIQTISIDAVCLPGGRTPPSRVIMTVVGTAYQWTCPASGTGTITLSGALSGYYDIDILLHNNSQVPKIDNLVLQP